MSILHKLLGKQFQVKLKIPEGVDTSQPGTYPIQIESIKEIGMANEDKVNIEPTIDCTIGLLADLIALDIKENAEEVADEFMVDIYLSTVQPKLKAEICKKLGIASSE